MKKTILVLIVIFLLHSKIMLVESSDNFKISYRLVLDTEDYPKVVIKITNSPSSNTNFEFSRQANALSTIDNLETIFNNISVKTNENKSLTWKWVESDKIMIYNGDDSDFIISYNVNALNLKRTYGMGDDEKFVIFRENRIFFIAGDIFLLPTIPPDNITVEFSLPDKIEIFSSLPKNEKKFFAKTDLWGNIIYDFQKTYFTGGKTIFNLTHFTEWGDEYIFIWFYKDPIEAVWLPSYGNTFWEQAVVYMKKTEEFSKYFRENIGHLPQHIVLFTNTINAKNISNVMTNTDNFHYIQTWPKYSEHELCHHILLQWGFFFPSQCKLAFNFGDWDTNELSISQIFIRGIVGYLENTIPSLLSEDRPYKGRIFEFFVLDKRGERFNIRNHYSGQNWYHLRYNFAAAKVFLLNQFIQNVTDSKKDINNFVKEMWNQVKDNTEPKFLTEEEIVNIFSNIVGESNKKFIFNWANLSEFNEEDFLDLLPDFNSYVDWMANKFFWGNKLLFLIFLDIVSAKGEEWPHFATTAHNILGYRSDSLIPFKKYLESLNKTNFTQQDIMDAIYRTTGENHADFFKFWEYFGYQLNPNSLLPLNNWNIDEWDESRLLNDNYFSVGNLRTEHYLSSIPQKAEIVLDNPDDDGNIIIQVMLQSYEHYPPITEAEYSLFGQNVTFLDSSQYVYENVFITSAFFKANTDDKANKIFNFDLILPSFSSHPKFNIYNNPFELKVYLGELYFPHAFNPINFEEKLVNDDFILENTYLDGEYYILKFPEINIFCEPNNKINVSDKEKLEEIVLFDKWGFQRSSNKVEYDLNESGNFKDSSEFNNNTNYIILISFIFLLLGIVIIFKVLKNRKS